MGRGPMSLVVETVGVTPVGVETGVRRPAPDGDTGSDGPPPPLRCLFFPLSIEEMVFGRFSL